MRLILIAFLLMPWGVLAKTFITPAAENFYEVTSRLAERGDVTLELLDRSFRELLQDIDSSRVPRHEKRNILYDALRLAPIAHSDPALYQDLLQFWRPIAEEYDARFLQSLDEADQQAAEARGGLLFDKSFLFSISASTAGFLGLVWQYPNLIEGYESAIVAVTGMGVLTMGPPIAAKSYFTSRELKKRKRQRAGLSPNGLTYAEMMNEVEAQCKGLWGESPVEKQARSGL